MAMAASLPIVLQTALSFLDTFLLSHQVRYGRSGARHRGMRSDRRNNLMAVITVLIRGCALQHGGIICLITKGWVRPLTLAEIACLAGISVRTVSRCIQDLLDLGLICTKQIKRKNPQTGQFEVSYGIRYFTKKFWKVLGLNREYDKSCQWAKANGHRRLILPFKGVSLKVKETFSKAGDLVKSALGNLSEGALRAQYWCDKIRKKINSKG